MANQEVTIQFEGYENNTATYVVLTNENDEIEEIRDGQSPSDTEEIDIQPIYVDEDDSDDAEMHVLESTVEEVYVEYIDIKSPSGKCWQIIRMNWHEMAHTISPSLTFQIVSTDARASENHDTKKLANGI